MVYQFNYAFFFFIQGEETTKKLKLISEKLNIEVVNQRLIDECVNDLNSVLCGAGEKHRIKIVRSNNNKRNSPKGFDSECES